MATSKLELAVGTGQWDAGLKKAQQALNAFTQSQGGLQNALDKENQKIGQFVQMMGKIDSTASTAKGQMNDYKRVLEQLTTDYNKMSDAQKKSIGQDYLNTIDQLKQKFQAAKQQVDNFNRSLGNTSEIKLPEGGGGLFSSDKFSGMLQVFGGNLMTKGFDLATSAVTNLVSEVGSCVQQGIELARQGEGIRIAFERLGRGDILDGLRQATHGTVTDLELMKAAVKFNDFKLPVEELGTMLAFAQQKAKDTGQSVDYMVDSIVTGLGRKSLMILDNLGLSAAQIKERMAETGDMTKAVGEIIREQMAKAGDYVETAADRAAQANVNLQNKMEELGRKFAPIEEASSQLWTSMKIGILDIIGGPLARLLNGLTEAGRQKNALNNINSQAGDGNTLAGKHLSHLRDYSKSHSADQTQSLADRQAARYAELENQQWRIYNQKRAQLQKARNNGNNSVGGGMDMGLTGLENEMNEARRNALAWRQVAKEYQEGAKAITNPANADIIGLDPTAPKTTNIPKPRKTNIVEEVFPEGSMKDLQRDMQELKKAQDLVTSPDEWQKYQQEIDAVTEKMNTLKGVAQKAPEMAEGVSGLNQKAIATYQSMLQESMKGMEYGSTDLTQTLANSIDVTTLSNLLTATMQQGINMTAIQLADGTTAADLWDKILGGENIPDSTWESLQTVINEKLAEMGIDPIKLDFKTGEVKQISNDAKEMTKDWNSAASAIQSVGQAMSQIEDPAAKVMGTIAQAIATIALTFAKSLEKTFTPWDWIAAAASGTATMISTISAIHSATGYAEGGIVKGNQYSGDNIWTGNAWVNSGELILNRAQQGVLADALSEPPSSIQGGNPYVSGENIFLGLNNYLRRAGYGELVTTKR